MLLAKPRVDTKGDSDIVSRLGVTRPVDFTVAPDEDILQKFQRQRAAVIERTGSTVSCLLVDEAQFLTEGQVDDLLRIAILESVPVLAYGIRTDFQTVAFPGSRRLLEIAHSLEELKTICRCGRKAVFNARKRRRPVHLRRRSGRHRRGGCHVRVTVRRLLPRRERRRAQQRLAPQGRVQLRQRAGSATSPEHNTSPSRRRPM